MKTQMKITVQFNGRHFVTQSCNKFWSENRKREFLVRKMKNLYPGRLNSGKMSWKGERLLTPEMEEAIECAELAMNSGFANEGDFLFLHL